jgi:imidazolonepropionase-like amidohydrolase
MCALVAAMLAGGAAEFGQGSAAQPGRRAYVGATIVDGTGRAPIENGVLIVAGGRIEAVGHASSVRVADGVERVDLRGRTIVPGFINAHGHVGETRGLEAGDRFNTLQNARDQLALYARYGVTTVVSLGGDRAEAGFRLRDEPDVRGRARVFVAGPVITARTPEAARAAVDEAARLKPDWIKIRVDDNLGTGRKMPPEVYRAVIEQAHTHQLRVAAHIFYLEDAKDLLRAGVDYLAHSVRDRDVDRELIDLMKARNVCLCPTLMREVSTFVYETRPAFFDDPFFEREADPAVVKQLEDPARQATYRGAAPQRYKEALVVARRNTKALLDAGVRIAMGTDTGPPARFQGYFEHLELEEMVRGGLTPMQALLSATRDAASCLGLDDRLGTLQAGRLADFLVLARSPLTDIANTKTVEAVYVGGQPVQPRTGASR